MSSIGKSEPKGSILFGDALEVISVRRMAARLRDALKQCLIRVCAFDPFGALDSDNKYMDQVEGCHGRRTNRLSAYHISLVLANKLTSESTRNTGGCLLTHV